MAYVFISARLFFLICAQKNQTHCTYVWRHKVVEAQRGLSYYGCKNLTHTSKTRQAKRTQMVATAWHDSRVCCFFRQLRIVRKSQRDVRAKVCEI